MEQAFQTYLTNEKVKIDQYILDFYKTAIEEEEEPYLRKFLSYSENFSKGPGRRILPICLINTYKGLSSDKDISETIKEVYQVSISMELLHISNLILDDLVDHEEIRRGLPTFHKSVGDLTKGIKDFQYKVSQTDMLHEFEAAASIYGGNIIALLGTEVISKSSLSPERKGKVLKFFLQGYQGMARGHLLDEFYKLLPIEKMTLEDYLILSSLKRGKQMETAVGLGAIMGNARKSQLEPLMQAMNKVGIVEQLLNDYTGTFGDPSKKSIDSDIKSGQCTALTVIAYQGASEDQKQVLNAILGNLEATEDQVETVRQIFQATGSVDFIKMYANSLRNDINQLMEKVYPGLKQETTEFFTQLLRYIIDRSLSQDD